MKLHLVRHGETEWNKLGRFQGQRDIPLNSRGLAQAKETARALAEDGEIALYSSPLQRTMQVADEISHLANVPVQYCVKCIGRSVGELKTYLKPWLEHLLRTSLSTRPIDLPAGIASFA